MKAGKISIVLFVIVLGCSFAASAQKQFKALLVTTTRGWHHESLHSGVLALQEMEKRIYLMWY